MNKWFLLSVILLIPSTIWSQNRVTINGFVNDAKTGEALIGAIIFDKNTNTGCSTNEFGFYSLTIKSENVVNLFVSYIGYTSETKILDAKNQRLNIKLKPGIEIGEVIVNQNRFNSLSIQSANLIKLNMQDVKTVPSVFGENDLIQVLRLTPGVQSGGEGKSQLFVRGGSPDQNLILLDDVALYYISHFGGLFSIFNSDAINNVELTKGGFPARYGGRLSSILDVRMKEGNLEKFEGNCTIGILSSRISLEGPIHTGKSSYIISFRKSILPLMKIVTEKVGTDFYDLNGKINFNLSENDRLMLSVYSGNDAIKTKMFDTESSRVDPFYTNKCNWGNKLAALRWNHLFSEKLFSNLTLSTVDYRFVSKIYLREKRDSLVYKTDSKLASGITDFNGQYDLKWFVTPDYSLRFGTKSSFHLFKPNNIEINEKVSSGKSADTTYFSNLSAYENSLYIENEINYHFLKMNIGARLALYSVEKKTFTSLEPRIQFETSFSKNLSFNASYSQMNQFIHLLTYSNAGVPSDYWMPTTALAKPEYAREFSVGLNGSVLQENYKVYLSAYSKKMNNMVEFKDGASLSGNLDRWETVVETAGKGDSRGIEFLFQKIKGKTNGWISATLSCSARQFSNINNGESFPFKYDRTLDVSLVINHSFNKNIEFSAVWNYGTGYPVTLAYGKYSFARYEEIIVWGKRNSSRMRDYHRLDVAVHFPYTIGQFNGTFSISILNLYNRKNPYYYFYQDLTTIGSQSGKFFQEGDLGLKLYQQSFIPFFPSVSYSFKF
jgi:outer membrane cobalamin receptor